MSVKSRLSEWPHTPLLIYVVSLAVPGIVLITALMWFLIGNPLGLSPTLGLVAFFASMLIGLFCFYAANSAMVRRLTYAFIPQGHQLFPSYALWNVWWRGLNHPSLNTRNRARLQELLSSNDPDELDEGIALAKATGRWHDWSQNVLRQSWSNEHPPSNIVQWEKLLRAGALATRYNEKFLPITFLAWQRYAPNAITRSLLDIILACGADINDIDPSGRSLLDLMVEYAHEKHIDFVAQDFDYLLGLGAIPTQKTVRWLRRIEGNTEAQLRADKIVAEWNRAKLLLVADGQEVARATSAPRLF